jgi:hypothetical protein
MTSTSTSDVTLKLIEFSNSKTITFPCQVDSSTPSSDASYDIILGSDFMTAIGIDIKYSTRTISWDGETIPLKAAGTLADNDYREALYFAHTQPILLQEMESRQQQILDADYSKVDVETMVDELDISPGSKRKLRQTLQKFPTLFGGGLGLLDIPPVTIELKPDAKPFNGRYYSTPKAFEAPFKKEILRMCNTNVLRKLSYDDDSPWASPSFAQPKKTGDIRVLTDFRKMNAAIERKPFPLPRIGETIQRLEKFVSATALDLSQGYYSIPICPRSQKICTTILPWGKYAYQRLPMGVACAPDIFQSIMMELLDDLDYVLVYIDDILIIQRESESEADHLIKVETVLTRLQTKGFRANLRKSFFMQKEVEYLGFLLTSSGIRPQPKKVAAMERMQAPKNPKQLKQFLGMVNFYRDVWPRRSHILAPLNKLTGIKSKTKWYWGEDEQRAFTEAKQMLTKEALLAFPDFSQPFHLYTDASDRQLGATVVQLGKPLGFYTRKLNPAQKNYTVGERELLGIVEGLKAFEGILRGQDVTVHTDHLNLLYSDMPSQRMIRWRLLMEEFHPQVVHVAGKDNDAADALSRLDMDSNDTDELEWGPVTRPLTYNDEVTERTNLLFPMASENELNYAFPLAPDLIKFYQDKDVTLQKELRTRGHKLTAKVIEGSNLLHRPDRKHNARIVVPSALINRVLDWYHTVLVHPGETRMEASIRSVYTWKNLRRDVQARCKTCHKCQLAKKSGKKKYGHLPPKTAECLMWNRVNVDLWGPATINNKNGKTYKIHVMTMIDPTTGWFELATLRNGPTALEAQRLLDSIWLARYPRPREIGFDGGSEFKAEFRELCINMNLKRKPSNSWNPQSNAILERVHQVLGDCLRTFDLNNADVDENDPFEEFLTAAAYAIRSAHHTTLGCSPAQLVFGRDMFMPVNFDADWDRIRSNKQQRINKNNERENKKRVDHQYSKGDLVTLERTGIIPKLSLPRMGPYNVVHAHENGNVTIQKQPYVTERVNIRRCKPYYQHITETNSSSDDKTVHSVE